jgi:hypothetical protein
MILLFFYLTLDMFFFCVKSMFSYSETHRMILEYKNHINSIYNNLDILIIKQIT